MSYQAVARFGMSIRETFSNSIALAGMNKNGKGAMVQISTVFGLVYHVAFGRVL